MQLAKVGRAVGKAFCLGLLGYGFPRFLVAIGVPLDLWIEALGANFEAVLWAFVVIFATFVFWLDTRYKVFEKLFAPSRQLEPSEGVALDEPQIYREGEITYVRIQIRNLGNELLQKCLVRVDRIEPLPDGWKPRDLPFIVPMEHQASQGRRGRFHLDPNMPKFLTLAKRAAGNLRNPISVLTEEESKHILPLASVSYTFELRASSEKGGNIRIFILRLDSKRELTVSNI